MQKLVVLSISISVMLSACCEVHGQEMEKEATWQERLPVSLSGTIPRGLPKNFEQKYWHSHNITEPRRLGYPDFFKLGRLFASDDADHLMHAIVNTDMEKMEQLIAKGADINEVGEYGFTPLFIAFCQDTDPRPFELLLKNGADPTKRLKADPAISWNFHDRSVVELGAATRYNRLFKLLFESKKVDLNQPGIGVSKGTPAEFALKSLIGYGAPPLKRLEFLVAKGYVIKFDLVKRWVSYSLSSRKEVSATRYASLAVSAIKLGGDTSKSFTQGNLLGEREFHQYRLIHLFARCALDNPERLHNKEVQKLLSLIAKKNLSLETAKQDLKRWERWSSQDLGGLVDLENQKRSEGKEELERWLTSDRQSKLAELEKYGISKETWIKRDYDRKAKARSLPSKGESNSKLKQGQNN